MNSTSRFSAETLITLPRRGAVVPNSDGTLAYFTESQHVLGGKTVEGYGLLDVASGELSQLALEDSASEVLWLGIDTGTLLYLSRGENGQTFIKTVDARKSSAKRTVIGSINAPVSGLKLKLLENGAIALLAVGLRDGTGALYNNELYKPSHTGKVTDSINPRIVSIQIMHLFFSWVLLIT